MKKTLTFILNWLNLFGMLVLTCAAVWVGSIVACYIVSFFSNKF